MRWPALVAVAGCVASLAGADNSQCTGSSGIYSGTLATKGDSEYAGNSASVLWKLVGSDLFMIMHNEDFSRICQVEFHAACIPRSPTSELRDLALASAAGGAGGGGGGNVGLPPQPSPPGPCPEDTDTPTDAKMMLLSVRKTSSDCHYFECDQHLWSESPPMQFAYCFYRSNNAKDNKLVLTSRNIELSCGVEGKPKVPITMSLTRVSLSPSPPTSRGSRCPLILTRVTAPGVPQVRDCPAFLVLLVCGRLPGWDGRRRVDCALRLRPHLHHAGGAGGRQRRRAANVRTGRRAAIRRSVHWVAGVGHTAPGPQAALPLLHGGNWRPVPQPLLELRRLPPGRRARGHGQEEAGRARQAIQAAAAAAAAAPRPAHSGPPGAAAAAPRRLRRRAARGEALPRWTTQRARQDSPRRRRPLRPPASATRTHPPYWGCGCGWGRGRPRPATAPGAQPSPGPSGAPRSA